MRYKLANTNKAYSRDQRGFTLSFAVILCIMFATLLYMVFYFLRVNTRESSLSIFRLQSIYLAESGNNRAMSRLNVKTLPEIDPEDLLAEEDDEFDEFFDDEEFDDFFDEEDDFFDDDFDDFDDEEDGTFLASIPRYINFYHKDPYYVNIDTGHKVTEAGYFALISAQQQRIATLKSQIADGEQFEPTEIPVQDLYFPLPEVNVQKIGSIDVEKGKHLKPGFRIVLAEKVPVDIRQKSIVDEYTNYVPDFSGILPRPILRGISPNYALPGEYLDIFLDGENIAGILPEISSNDIAMLEHGDGRISIAITEQAKAGRYTIKIGPNKAQFYIVPFESEPAAPSIIDITMAKPRDGNPQFIKMFNREKIKNIKITGENLSNGKDPPIIVPDAMGILVDIVSFKKNEIIFNIETIKAEIGSHFISIFTKGGQSNSWIFNIEPSPEDLPDDPFIGSYSSVLTLIEANSLSNLPIKSVIEDSPSGRPEAVDKESSRPTADSQANSGRPGQSNQPIQKSFDLLRSDLETVWKLETVATVNKLNYKETKIVRRSAPRADAAITTNNRLSFGQSSLIIEGLLQATARLEESSIAGDTLIHVEGVDPDQELFESRENENRPQLVPTGAAVIENLGLGINFDTPAGKGFTAGSIAAITSLNRGGGFTDFAIVESTGLNTVTVEEPGFKDGHFLGDELTQFIPSVITPEPISERDAQRSLDPPSSFVDIPGKRNFDYTFRTRFDKIKNWSGVLTNDTSVPDDLTLDYEGYFGLNIIEGVPDYTGANALYGQGALIIDTTLGGRNPNGATVSIGGSSKLPSLFEGVIYIFGNLQITGPTEIRGAIIVNSPNDNSTIRIGGSGNITFNPKAIQKAIIHIPFTEELRTRVLSKSSGQKEILKK